MNRRLLHTLALCAGLALLASCNSTEPSAPASSRNGTRLAFDAVAVPTVHFNEIHYDNDGTDAGEAIEIAGPAGTSIEGWSVVLYNGSGGTSYNTQTLTGTLPTTCSGQGVVVLTYPSNGIQNGSPDGMALVNSSGTVVEFLSYEGTVAATDGPANGTTSTDIGVSETGSTPVDNSLQRNSDGTWAFPATNSFGACNTDGETPPPPPTLPETRFSEIHYDNDGTDADEAIEIEGPAGTSVAGWQVLLYNGNDGAVYNTQTLSGTIPATCTDRGVLVLTYPSNGIQNGSPDGFALVNASGTVVEFLSYEGAFSATSGAATGMTSTDIGVAEATDTPSGFSLQRNSSGVWAAPSTSSFGACNGSGSTPPPPPPPSIVINELMADPLLAAGGASWGEWFEVTNVTAEPVDLQGWTIASGGGSSQPPHTITSSVVVPPGGYIVLGRGDDSALNGGITLDYNYFTGTSSTIFLDATDWLALRNPSGATVDSVRWTSSATIVKGVTRALRDPSSDNTSVDGAAWAYSTTTFGDGDFGTPGAANGTLSDTPPAIPNFITFTGRLSSDPPLPVGFEDQIFATLHSGDGSTITTTFTWTSETPTIATVDQDGVVHALAAGTLRVRATAADGSTRTYSLPTRVATLGGTAQYEGNTEFGEPADGTPSDDILVRRLEYTTSFNPARGIPNWVSYDLEASHFGPEDRCDCFTFDPELPAGLTHYTTADYTGAGTFQGFGIDRGHLARSFDRTSGSLDNATTYYFSNIIPQASDLNQGPWAELENYLGDLAQHQDKEVYIIAGPAGSQGTLKNEGRITLPAYSWKVAVIMPRNEGLDDVTSVEDVDVIAVIMPNQPGVREVDWHTYLTTVNAVETLSGYNLLALLPDNIETLVESGAGQLQALVDQLVETGQLNGGIANSLSAKLQVAATKLDQGDQATAINQLNSVLHQLDDLVSKGRLSASAAQPLRDAAVALIGSLM